nr:MAG: hypothetical protein DIU78_05770 [Pseudomonadota bacterium]
MLESPSVALPDRCCEVLFDLTRKVDREIEVRSGTRAGRASSRSKREGASVAPSFRHAESSEAVHAIADVRSARSRRSGPSRGESSAFEERDSAR